MPATTGLSASNGDNDFGEIRDDWSEMKTSDLRIGSAYELKTGQITTIKQISGHGRNRRVFVDCMVKWCQRPAGRYVPIQDMLGPGLAALGRGDLRPAHRVAGLGVHLGAPNENLDGPSALHHTFAASVSMKLQGGISMIPLHVRCLLIFSAMLLAGCKPPPTAAATNATASGASATDSVSTSTTASAAATADTEPLPTRFGLTPELQAEMRKLIADFVAQHKGTADDAKRLFKEEYELLLRPAYEFEVPMAEAWPKSIQDDFVVPARKKFDDNEFFKTFKIVLPKWADPLKPEYEAGTISGRRRELLFVVALSKALSGYSVATGGLPRLQQPPKGTPEPVETAR
jgi:hypothetical protein